MGTNVSKFVKKTSSCILWYKSFGAHEVGLELIDEAPDVNNRLVIQSYTKTRKTDEQLTSMTYHYTACHCDSYFSRQPWNIYTWVDEGLKGLLAQRKRKIEWRSAQGLRSLLEEEIRVWYETSWINEWNHHLWHCCQKLQGGWSNIMDEAANCLSTSMSFEWEHAHYKSLIRQFSN